MNDVVTIANGQSSEASIAPGTLLGSLPGSSYNVPQQLDFFLVANTILAQGANTYQAKSNTLTSIVNVNNAIGALTNNGNGSFSYVVANSGLSAAVQTDMEAATSNVVAVTPGSQQFHPGMVKAWGNITVTGGVPSITVGYNISSIVDTAVGKVQINLTKSFSSNSYVILSWADYSSSSGSNIITNRLPTTANSFLLEWFNNGSVVDPSDWMFVCLGDQ